MFKIEDNYIYHLSNNNKNIKINKYSSIYAFDLDDTIITTKSGNKFPKDNNDWIILNEDIKKLIKEENNLYVIFTNQSKINKTNSEGFINKLKDIIKEIGDINIFISIDKENKYYRKPFIGLYELFNSIFDIKQYKYKYYIGDAGGRENDFNNSDRLFAYNIKFEYYTPEAFFNYKYIKKTKSNIKKIQQHIKSTYYDKETEEYDKKYNIGYSINKSDYKKNDYTELNNILKNNNLKLFLIMGYPGSGKSSFCHNHLKNIEYIGLDDLKGNKLKSYKILNDKLKNNKSCVVDCLNNTKEGRKKYIDIGLKYNCEIYIIHILTNKNLSKYLNNYRYNLNHKILIPDLVYNIYDKNYNEVSKEEENIKEILNYEIELFDGIFDKLF